MSANPVRDFTLHRTACPRCRTAQPPHGFCTQGQALYDAILLTQRPGVAPAVLAWSGAMLVLVTVCAMLWLVSCAPAAAPTLAAAGAVAPQGQFVWVLAQTERSVQIGSSAETGPGEVAHAHGWPRLTLPARVCVAFEGAPGSTTNRTARLLDRSACQGVK